MAIGFSLKGGYYYLLMYYSIKTQPTSNAIQNLTRKALNPYSKGKKQEKERRIIPLFFFDGFIDLWVK